MNIADSHTDFLTELKGRELAQYVESAKMAGVKIISSAVYTTNKGYNITTIKKFCNSLTDLEKIYKINLPLSIEDCGFLQTEKEEDDLINLKPLSVGLTWNYKNQYAGGALDIGGITTQGINFIKKLEQNNVLVDTAHLNRKSFYLFSKITKFPIYNSHSNIYSLYKHKRNLTNKQIEAIVKSNGYMGLTFYKNFITNKKEFSTKEVAKQFDYLIKKFGYLNFGLGTDYYGVEPKFLPTNLQQYSQLKTLARELTAMGYSKIVIQHLFYKNYLDFLKRVKSIK